ncbi:MAG: exonuclease [Methanobacteriota archaeon]|nr:MAG: exonuclease [Euryarchaeota archaeon]TLZ78588.1 MAG: exonuclease [Euryarchaeota archaeon]
MIGRFGLTTGRSTGVDTDPCAVSIRPIRASPSRSRISNTRGHQTAANKAFPRLRGPLRKGFLRRAIPMARMLRETFVHVPGVGYRTEERLWRMGIRTWDDFSAAGRPRRLSLKLGRRIEDELARSSEALHRGRHRYFARGLSPRDHWRAWREFRHAIAFLDIETTGLSIGRDAITVVGVFDGTRKRSFVQGDNLEDLPAAMARAKLLVTFNGARFDVPFLRKAFPRMALDQIHLDLLHPLRRLGFVGGLKAIESQVGILRSEETSGLAGFDAVRLWHAYDAGDDDALDLLLEYNMEDVVNLEPLAELAYEGLRSLCLDGGFVTADRLPPPR